MATIASLAVNFLARTAELRRGLDTARGQNRRFVRDTRRQFGGLSGTFAALRASFVGIFAGVGVGGALRLSDEFASVRNLLRASGFEGDDLADSLARVQQITRVTRGDLESTGRLYALLNRNAESLGANQDEIAVVTAAVQQAFALAGASAQEAAGATRQLSQALASGVLRGQELNSVMEQAPLIARAISDNLGISLGTLRELAAEGQITSEVVFASILNEAENLNTAFQASDVTFGQLARLVRNELLPVFNQLATNLLPAITRGTSFAVNAFQSLSDNIDVLLRVLAGAFAFAATRIAIVLGQFLVGALVSVTTSIGGMIVAARAGSLALGTLLGPIGLLVQAGVVLASVFGQELADAFNRFTGRTEELEESASDLDDALNSITGDTDVFLNSLDPERLAEFQMALDGLSTGFDDVGSSASTALDTLPGLGEEFEALEGLANQALDGITDGLTDLFTRGETDARAFADSLIREFIRIQIRTAITRSLNIPFGGFRQNGGPVRAGQAYVVGEAGPEIFSPNTNGTIIPNGAGGGEAAAAQQVTYNINATDARSFQQLVAQDPSFIHNVAQRGARTQGGLRR